MNYIKLEKNKFGYFRVIDSSDDSLFVLLTMVFNEPLGVSSVEGFLMRCERDKACDGENFETFYAELAPGNKIVIGDLFADEDNPHEIAIDKDILINLFTRYEAVVKQNPDEIVITRVGNNFKIEPHFF